MASHRVDCAAPETIQAALKDLVGVSFLFVFVRAHEIERESAEEIVKEFEEKGWGRNKI